MPAPTHVVTAIAAAWAAPSYPQTGTTSGFVAGAASLVSNSFCEALEAGHDPRVCPVAVNVERGIFGIEGIRVGYRTTRTQPVEDVYASAMYRGEILGSGLPVDEVIEISHEYTKKLMLAAPVADPIQQSECRRLRREIAATSGLPASL